jgi:hypothetical protein
MSTNQGSVSQETLEQTKSLIKTLVSEISDLSKTDTPADQFYPAVLQRIVQALAAIGGAVWLLDDQRRLRLAYQLNMAESLLDQDGEDSQKHGRLLMRMLSNKASELVPPGAMIGDGQEGNPTRYLLVISPLQSNKEVAGMIEVFQRPEAPPPTQRGYLRFLEQMCQLISGWLKSQTLQRVSGRQQLWQQADQFARLVHNNLELRDTAFTIANEGRRLIECDRVSVATCHGRSTKVIAISGQDTIENRSNIVSALNRLATRVVAAGEPLWYDGSTEDLPPQLEEAIEEYVDLSHGRTVTVLPIRRPELVVEGDIQSKQTTQREDNSQREIIGALIVEQIETQLSREVLQSRVDLVYEHSCRALANSLSHNNLFLMPLWRTLGRASWMFRGDARQKTLAIGGLALAALAGLFFYKIDFDLRASGELKPEVERQVFAITDGEVEEVLVDTGDMVKAGDPLVRLKDTNLEVQLEDVFGKMQTALKQKQSISYQRGSRTLSDIERNRLAGEEAEVDTQLKSYKAEYDLLKEKKAGLVRTAPIDGMVVTWDVKRLLRSRPVVTGQVLMAIADSSKDWYLELDMPEKRMRYLDKAVATNGEQPLPVEFIQTTNPSVRFTGSLSADSIHQRAEVHPEEGATVKLRVEPSTMQDLSRRPGARVTANVKCGKESAAFVWFHEIVEWVYSNLLF